LRGRATPASLSLAVAGTLLVSACAASTRYKVLSFFFEGVPRPGQVDAPSTDESTALPGQDPLSLLRAANRTEVFWHRPFVDRECARCHSMVQGGAVRDVPGGICLSCHEGLLADRPFVHGPAAVGACVQCHHPHRSEIPGILLREGEATCTHCHALEDLIPGDHHGAIGTTPGGCVECHDPHGGVDRLFLKPKASEGRE